MPESTATTDLCDAPVVSQFMYSEEDQIRILALLKYDQALDLDMVRSAYFTNPIFAEVAEVLSSYRREYRQLPTQAVIESQLQTRFDPGEGMEYPVDLLAAALEVVEKMDSLDLSEIPYYRDLSISFARTQRIEQALLRKQSLLSEGKHDDFARLISSAVSIGANVNVPVLDVLDASVWFDMATDHYGNKIPTGIPELDLYTNGGLGECELTTIVAPPSGGKTQFLLHLAFAALQGGYTPLLMSVELDSWKLAVRIAQRVLSLPKDEVLRDRERTIDLMSSYRGSMNGHTIRAMKFLPGIHGMTHIRSEYRRYCDMHDKPPLLIVDYADKIAPEKGVDKRIALENIYMDLFSMAGEERIHIATATQTNRQGADHSTIKMTDIAECFAKAAISDYIFTLATDQDDPSIKRLFVAKNRDGAALANIRLRVNLETQTLEAV